MKKIWKQLVTGCLMAGWMIVIFCFSAQPAEQSERLSGTVAYQVVDATGHVLQMEWSGQQISFFAQMLDYPIRKAAHMTEYAILGLLSFLFYTTLGKGGRRGYLLALATSGVYAATDEMHQLFVPGRGGRVSDVCIDTAGAVTGLLILYIIAKMIGKHCEKKKVTLQ